MIIGFMGAIGAGKSTAAEYLRAHSGFRVVSFATPLKNMVKKITPDGLINKVRDRALLQFIGTDYYRGIDDNYWLQIYRETVQNAGMLGFAVATDDARFDNEFDLIKSQYDGHLVWLDGGEEVQKRIEIRDGHVTVGIAGHASESGLRRDDPRIDFHINNRGTTDELFDSLDTLIKQIEIQRPLPNRDYLLQAR